MKKNYASMDDIAEELKNVGIEKFLDFYASDDYEFARCKGCDGPLLDHLEVKCIVKDKVRYGMEIVKTIENWPKNIPGFRDQLKAKQENKEDVRATKIEEYEKIPIKSAKKKNRPEGTTQLSKPIFLPLWSGQKYNRWKIEVEK